MATKKAPKSRDETSSKLDDRVEECFVLMPISDPEGYEKGHFRHVFSNIIEPACDAANFKAVRGDDVKQTNLIHLDILKKLLDTPIAICDLSTQNPNVLFELGIRQAFDKPVVLIQEQNTPKIFDISPLRYLEYSSDMKYHEVLATQKALTESLEATRDAVNDTSDVNSIVKLLSLAEAAKVPNLEDHREDFQLSIIQSELRQMRQMLESGFSDSFVRNAPVRKNWTKVDQKILSSYESMLRDFSKKDFSTKTDSKILNEYSEALTALVKSIESELSTARSSYLEERLAHLYHEARVLLNQCIGFSEIQKQRKNERNSD